MSLIPCQEAEIPSAGIYVYKENVLCSVASVMSNSLRPVDCSLPGSSVHGILRARILEWVAIVKPHLIVVLASLDFYRRKIFE